jgi:hypothetical protein
VEDSSFFIVCGSCPEIPGHGKASIFFLLQQESNNFKSKLIQIWVMEIKIAKTGSQIRKIMKDLWAKKIDFSKVKPISIEPVWFCVKKRRNYWFYKRAYSKLWFCERRCY